MKTKSTLLTLLLCLSATSAWAGEKLTIVTENTVDVSNLFTHPELQKVRPGDSGVPGELAHAYTLRATYTIIKTEGSAVIEKVAAGCDGMDGGVSCWEDHLEGTLDLRNPGNSARWELIDQASGKTLATRTVQLALDPLRIVTATMNDKIDFSGAMGIAPLRPFPSELNKEYFLDRKGKFSLYFSEMYLDDLYRSAKLMVEPRGNGRYALVGIEYGGQTATGKQIHVVPGAEFPNAGVWLSKSSDHQHPYLVGEPRSDRPFGTIKVITIEN